MSKFTERLVQVGIMILLLWVMWNLSERTFFEIVMLRQRASVMQNQLTVCTAELTKNVSKPEKQ